MRGGAGLGDNEPGWNAPPSGELGSSSTDRTTELELAKPALRQRKVRIAQERMGATTDPMTDRAEANAMNEASASPPPRYSRRLSDKILIAFHHACDQGDFEAAEQLLHVLEMML